MPSVMTALCGYGGLHFSTAVEVLICDMNDMNEFIQSGPSAKKIAGVIPVSIVLCDLTGSWTAYRSE